MSTHAQQPEEEVVPWRHAVLSTPLYTAATIYTGALVLGVAQDEGAHLPAGLLAVGSVAGIVAASASRFIRTTGQRKAARWFHTAFTTTWTTATYAWLNWTAHAGPWTFTAAATIAAATAALGPLYSVDRWLRRDIIAAQWAEEASSLRGGEAAEWERLFADVGARGVEVGKPFTTRSGYGLPLNLTQTPFETLLGMQTVLETRKGGLRSGALRLARAESGIASEAILYVSTRDVLAETIPLPEDAHPLTISEPLTLGMLESGDPFEVVFRQNSVFIAGKKGSGKSVLLHCLISLLTRCVDAVIWMIDLAAGNTAKRWLRPWAEGWKDRHGRLIDRPILDWVATDHKESMRLLKASVAVADGRAGRMPGGKIRPKKHLPALVVISDENPDLMAVNPEAPQVKARGIKKGRKAAVDYVDAGQRGTGPNTGGGEVSSQYDTVIGMKTKEKAEGQFVFSGYYNQIDLSKLPGNGALYVLDEERGKEGGVGPERAKGYFVNDDDEDEDGRTRDDIEQLAVDRWDIRPDLDAESQADAAPFGYQDRWSPERTVWLADALGIDTPTTRAAKATAEHTHGGNGAGFPADPVGTATAPPPHLPPIEDYANRYKDWTPTQPPQTPAEPAEGDREDDPRLREAIDRALHTAEQIAQEAAATPEPETDSTGDARQAALMLLLAAGPNGTGASAIARELYDDFGTTRQTVVGWLKSWSEEGEAVRTGTGTKTRYVHRQHAPHNGDQ